MKPPQEPNEPAANRWWWLETLLVFMLSYLKAGWLPPDVNEAHYLTKARHYWQPAWCPSDFFLDSADAHAAFYWTFGWVCAVASLPAAAWIGRVAIWLLLSWAWQRLSFSLVPLRMAAVLSGGLMIVLTTVGHMAGEWIVGGVEAKGFAYVLLILGMERLVRNRWNAAWLLLGAAAAMHVLVGGWGVVAAMFAWLVAGSDRPTIRSMLPALVGGFALSLPGLVPALLLNRGVDPELVAQASEIYVMERLPHHLVFSKFKPVFMARHALIATVLAGLFWLVFRQTTPSERLARLRRLAGFIGGAAILTVIGIAIDLSTLHNDRLASAWLRLYWYRLGDMLIPAGVALLLPLVLWQLSQRRPRLAQLAASAAAVAALVPILAWSYRAQQQRLPPAVLQAAPQGAEQQLGRLRDQFYEWKKMCAWVKEHTPADAVFLTPRSQQTFKWYAQRAEVVSVKDIPQDALGLIEWRERRARVLSPTVFKSGQIIDRYAALTDDNLIELANRYGADFVIFERRKYSRPTRLERVYPTGAEQNYAYSIYRIPKVP